MSRRSPTAQRSAVGGFCFAADADANETPAVFWHPADYPAVLTVTAEPDPSGGMDAFDVRRFETMATVLRQSDGGEALLIDDGERRLQIAVAGGTLLDGPVRLTYRLAGFAGLEPGILSLRRLGQLHRLGRLPRQLFPPEPRAGRWLAMLRAYEGWRSGAGYRDIAAALFGSAAVREDWAGRSDYLRLRVQRLLRGARQLLAGGYRKLLL